MAAPYVTIPKTAVPGLIWPAVPGDDDGILLALQRQFEYTQWLTPDQLEAAQARQLRSLLRHARTHVPFYRTRLPDPDAVPEDAPLRDLLEGIPILQRSAVQSAGDTMRTQHVPNGHAPLREVSTSGSTGKPLTVQTSYVTWLVGSALNMRYHFWHKRDLRGRVASIRMVHDDRKAAVAENKPGPWAFGYHSGNAYTFPITEPTDRQLAWLRQVNPHYLLTHPTNLRALIERSAVTGGPPPAIREAVTMSEAMDDDLRALCWSAWRVRLTDGYTAQEAGPIAFQCPEHEHYHVMAESLLVEVLDDQDRPCRPGETGRIVLTTLANFASPLIRYEIGDYVELGPPCPCGRGLPVLTRIMGRTRNLLVLPDGSRVWPRVFLSSVRQVAPVSQVQMVQVAPTKLEFRIVTEKDLTEAEIASLQAFITERLSYPFDVDVKQVPDIPRSKSGKYEDFLSLLA